MQTDRNLKKTPPFFLPWQFPLKFLSKARRHLCPSLTPLSLIFQTTGVLRYGLGRNKSTSIQWVKERVILGGDLFSSEMLTTVSKVKVPLVFKWTKSGTRIRMNPKLRAGFYRWCMFPYILISPGDVSFHLGPFSKSSNQPCGGSYCMHHLETGREREPAGSLSTQPP